MYYNGVLSLSVPIYIVPLVGFKPGSSKWHTFWLSLGEKQQEPLDSDSEEVLNLQDVNELTGEAAEGDGVESVVNELTKQQVLVKYLQVTVVIKALLPVNQKNVI